MTEKEKLVDLLWECVDPFTPYGEMADYLLSKGVTFQKWIPVSERLPEQHSSVIVYKKNKRFSMLHYSSALGFHFYDSEWGDVTVDDVTHWMPLPEPPKVNEDEM